MRTPDRRPAPGRQTTGRSLGLLALALGCQAGCGREFYREWANQDASEAVFEKSRDPRWRLDMFSITPPALARFSDPYDPDRPPAPPDDHAVQATSPVPQWPENRLLVPPEGTGYLDMLDNWQRQQPGPGPRTDRPGSPPSSRPNGAPGSGALSPPTPPDPAANPPAGGGPNAVGGAAKPPSDSAVSPFAPGPGATPPGGGANSGPETGPLTPNRGGDRPPPPPLPPLPGAGRPRADRGAVDLGVKIVAFQQTGLPMPVPTSNASGDANAQPPPAPDINTGAPRQPGGTVSSPAIGMDPQPGIGIDLNAPVGPPPGQSPETFRAAEAMASELAGILVPDAIDFDEAEAAGLPRTSRPYLIDMRQAFTLALINSRIYQFNLEQIYAAALAVTLQRFAFTPQFYAGLSPLTPVVPSGGGLAPSPGGGFAGVVPVNQFAYQTRETGTQISSLSIGTVAGVGKLFNSGARVLAGFANQVVFNFVGHNSFQPRVQSFLPLNIVQPFLRGGGRAVTLEGLTQVERSLLYQIRLFAKFRQEFTVATLIGGSVTNFGSAVPSLGFTGGGNSDPTIGFINVLEDLQLVENFRKNIAAYEQFVVVFRELVNGEVSGLTNLQLDQVGQGLLNARLTLIQARIQYRSDLDSFKLQMGIPPDVPLMPNRSLTQPFHDAFEAIDEWQRNPRRDIKDLPKYLDRLPQLRDLVLDGRSVLNVYRASVENKFNSNNEDGLEDLLLAAERTAMEHRLDLMNQRATLYDVWRQIKVQANSLMGYFNVALTNQFITPPTTTNPFGFNDQAKAFSLVINAELPLVRVNERNNFRAALITYQRQRRALMNAEDSIKLLLRQEIRSMQQFYLNYEIAKGNFILSVRQKDQALEQILAPPAAAGGGSQAPLQVTNLVGFQNSLVQSENALVTSWYQYQLFRLQVYRDLGTLPIDEWEAFDELFPELRNAGGDGASASRPGPAGAPEAGGRAPAGVGVGGAAAGPGPGVGAAAAAAGR